MEKILIYKRPGKFNKPEFFICLDELYIIKSRETPKAYACGSWDGNKNYVDGWIAKSLCQVINGKIYAPTWTVDKWTELTYRICRDYYNREFDVRDFPVETINNGDGTITVKQEGRLPVTMVNIPSDWEDDKEYDDVYWSNKFAEEERKQEEAAYKAKMEYEMSLNRR